MKPKHVSDGKVSIRSQSDPLAKRSKANISQITPETLYNAIYDSTPNACLFTIVPEPDHTPSQAASITQSASIAQSSTATSSVESIAQSSTATSSVESIAQSSTATSSVESITQSSTATSSVESIAQSSTVMPTVTSSLPQSSNVIPAVIMSTVSTLPNSFVELYDAKYRTLKKELLLQKSREIFLGLSITDEQSRAIELVTRPQRKSNEWYNQRQGRITASLFHDVFTFKERNNSVNLLKRLLSSPDISNIPAIKWGIEKEDIARLEYVTQSSPLHQEFKCISVGLIVNPLYPHLGASPDALVECSCCGQGIVEIKCPFSAKDSHPAKLHEFKNSFLNKFGLNRNHKYFTQVQGQLAVCQKRYCDFIVWTPKGMLVERIEEDPNFTESLVRKLTTFYVAHMLPEILTRTVTDNSRLPKTSAHSVTAACSDHEEQLDIKYCICQEGEYGKMICCDNSECKILWFHYPCVGITRAPKGAWFCPQCKN